MVTRYFYQISPALGPLQHVWRLLFPYAFLRMTRVPINSMNPLSLSVSYTALPGHNVMQIMSNSLRFLLMRIAYRAIIKIFFMLYYIAQHTYKVLIGFDVQHESTPEI